MRTLKFVRQNKTKYISILVIAIITLLSYELKSQTAIQEKARNAVYLEVGGIGSYGSLNYERLVLVKSNLSLGLRIGFSSYRLKDFTNEFNPDLIIPLAISGLYGKQHKLEVGLGQAMTSIVRANPSNFEAERELDLHANFIIGYRYQKEKGGLLIRMAYTPIIEFYKNYRHWAGLSIGYAF